MPTSRRSSHALAGARTGSQRSAVSGASCQVAQVFGTHRREASSRLMLRWLKTVVVSDEEKAPVEASGGDREGERERIVGDVVLSEKPGQLERIEDAPPAGSR